MADKSKDDFRQNPFKKLKGFSASNPGKEPEAVKRPPQSKREPDDEDDSTAFAREMNRLGLPAPKPLDAPRESLPAEEEPEEKKKKASVPVTERDLFLAALGEMEITFTDEFPAEEEPRAEPRRMRQLRQGKIRPESTLDLHGLSRADARQRVHFFLENARHHGQRTVLVVTGRGKSSGSEPVVRSEVESYLNAEGRGFVSEWGRAPRQYGGEGALVIFLKGEK